MEIWIRIAIIITLYRVSQVHCDDGFECISSKDEHNQPITLDKDLFCDGFFDCEDLSDELLCPSESERPESTPHEFRANEMYHTIANKLNLTYTKKMLDTAPTSKPFTALDFIHYDRNFEGAKVDSSECENDEFVCPGFDGEEMKEAPRQRRLGTSFKQCVKLNEICDKKLDCQFGEDERFCRSNFSKGGNHQVIDHFHTNHHIDATHHFGISAFKINHTTMEQKLVEQIQCNDILSTLEKNDIDSLETHNSLNETISIMSFCDGVFDCSSRVDEMFCPGRFYCKSGDVVFIKKRYKMDGKADCQDGSDEWAKENTDETMASGKTMIKDELFFIVIWIMGTLAFMGNITVIGSSILELLSIKYRHFDLRLKSVINSITNSASKKTPSSTSSNYTGTESRRKRLRLCNLILVLNLAIADFLMSIYLIVLALVKTTRWGGHWKNNEYWKMDNIWRTSQTCTSLGVVVMTASLTSLYTLFGLTSLRMHTVIRPFSNWPLNPKYTITYCIVIWCLAICLSLLPLLPQYKSWYVQEVLVALPHFKPPVINQSTAEELVRHILRITPTNATLSPNPTWLEMETILAEASPQIAQWRHFGFYSAHSVCVPKLFVEVGESAWEYTVFFITMNSFLVLYISAAYIAIYFKTKSRMNKAKSHSSSLPASGTNDKIRKTWVEKFHELLQKVRIWILNFVSPGKNSKPKENKLSQMQARIAVLVITDCVCWLPICMMGFARLAGVPLPPNAYAVSAIVLLPINSALNPVLYSKITKTILHKIANICR